MSAGVHPETALEAEGSAESPALPIRRDASQTPRLGCKTPMSAGRALARWSPVSLAYAIERGLVTDWPHEFTRAGWRWVRRSSEAAS